ncbi:MAG: transglycosylase SLT domain-containing protein [Candidatus Obscuribacter sp.]|nr:transglycosylase SLT domain-containing protein [Candidatus Obscuribacter sp.]MBK9277078.1 transglycosylase SLT domain-containing protein [Candidatus Obscuribacter sp.]
MSEKPAEVPAKKVPDVAKVGDHHSGENQQGAGLQHEAAKVLSSQGGNEAHKAAQANDGAGASHDVTIVENGKPVAKGGTADGAVDHKPAHKAAEHHVVHKEAHKPASAEAIVAEKSGGQAGTDSQPKPDASGASSSEGKPLEIVDKTAEYADKFKDAAEVEAKAKEKADAPPKITVSLKDNSGEPAERKEPHYVVKRDGKVEMHGDPVKLGAKDVRVEVEREPGEVNPSAEQQAATDKLVAQVNADLQKAFPDQADKVVLDDQGDVVSRKTEQATGLKPPAEQSKLSPETRESVDQTKRLHRSGGVDMPRAATEGMGSFETRDVPRQKGETDKVAAGKEAWAGLFKPDKDHPYETVRKTPEGEHRVGRYGFNGNQLESWLSSLTPEMIDKLIAEGKLPKSFANPEFLAKFKEFAAKLKNGEQPTPAEMKQFLPKEAQETIAGKLLDDMNKATGDNAGMSAAGLVSGKTADTMDQTFMTSPEAQELSRAGKTLFDVATQRQLIEGDGSKLGRLPEGDRRELVEKALEIAGQPVTDANIRAVNTIVQHESSWNPGVTNNWDINAQRGIPSQGLMQTIPPTFNAHKDRSGQVEAAGHSNTIKDPLANLVAGIKYSEHRYGSLQNVPGVRSMAQGGGYKPY